MALIRGSMSHHPCPICLVKSDEQNNLNKSAPLRTVENTQEILDNARKASKKILKEEILSSHSLRDIEVSIHFELVNEVCLIQYQSAFFEIANSSPFRALSWDHMHNNAHGLDGKHFTPSLQKYISTLGRAALSMVDSQ